jgi:putative mRNA 3-end processing factor
MAEDVLQLTDRGLYCPAGDFHIDPWRPVPRALITHGHSDHARPGMGAYLATAAAAPAIRARLGVTVETIGWGERRRIGGARVSFHPAGHLPGSAQIRIEAGGQVWVVSGDYKTAPDRLSEPFEPVRADVFVTECTFGLPVFRWRPEDALMAEIAAWWAAAAGEGRDAVLGVYALGKAQRILAGIDPGQGPVLAHGAVLAMTGVLRAQGLRLPPVAPAAADPRARPRGALVLAPPSALGSPWMRRFPGAATAIASGWMALRGIRRRRGAERGFVISDHADWPGLIAAVRATGAARVIATHGYTAAFARHLAEAGYETGIYATAFSGETLEVPDDPGPMSGPEISSGGEAPQAPRGADSPPEPTDPGAPE